MNLTGQRAMRDLRLEIFSHVQRLPSRFFTQNPLGRVMTRMTNDVENLNEMFSSGLVALVGDFVKMIGIVAIMVSVNLELALVTFAIVPVLFALAWISGCGCARVPGDPREDRADQRLPAGNPRRDEDRAALRPRGPEHGGLPPDQRRVP
jgi:ABC-type multidrug transport system fused ATPase/permease subunit